MQKPGTEHDQITKKYTTKMRISNERGKGEDPSIAHASAGPGIW